MQIYEKHDISHLAGFQTPASARYFFVYDGDREALCEACRFAREQDQPILVVSGGRNTVFAFDEYPGLVIHNASCGYTYDATSHELRVQSGQSIWELAEMLARDHGVTLWDRFLGLPGSIGGAVYGNAGCFGLEIGPYVTSIEVMNTVSGDNLIVTGEELSFDYRSSVCRDHPEWCIMEVTCDLSHLREKYPAPAEPPLEWRNRVQPSGFSCGSFFRNPSREHSAGSLLERSGLRGYHHGGAYFSDKHANFLMSDGTAIWRDILALIAKAQEDVLQQTGYTLTPEVRIITA